MSTGAPSATVMRWPAACRVVPHTVPGSSSTRPPGPQPLLVLSGPVKSPTAAALTGEDQSRGIVNGTVVLPFTGTVTESSRSSA